MSHRFSFRKRCKSFRHAVAGIGTMIKTQHNAWIHTFATAAAVGFGTWCRLSPSEWCWIVIAIVAVWTAEALNTAFEFLADVASPEFHPLVEKAKDVAAGAVLISAIGASVIGALVLGPYIFALCRD